MKLTISCFIYLFIIDVLPAQDTYQSVINKYRIEQKIEHINDKRAPLKETDFNSVHYFKPNEAFVVKAHFIGFSSLDTILIPTSSGKIKKFLKAGILEFSMKEEKLQLTIFLSTRNSEEAQSFFLPFRDKTNGRSTYGGGRFMDIPVSALKDGFLEIDFNKAYNPWCAYSDGFNCPIPPSENTLNIKIAAGEKKYTGERKEGSKKS
ncbi:MAG: DUF1684 domain-containing protein [Saprospiraceae bacterium]|nr:DUF1684 domain-containing protein [Saprospiraceae bacterium]